MAPTATAARGYTCSMHSDVHEAAPGKCPHYGMALVPEGARFALLRHMLGSPRHVAIMLAVMAALMAAAMMMMR
jgi:Heavy metal binding domain